MLASPVSIRVRFNLWFCVVIASATRSSFKSGSFVSLLARKLRSKAGERRHSHVVDAFLLAQSGP